VTVAYVGLADYVAIAAEVTGLDVQTILRFPCSVPWPENRGVPVRVRVSPSNKGLQNRASEFGWRAEPWCGAGRRGL